MSTAKESADVGAAGTGRAAMQDDAGLTRLLHAVAAVDPTLNADVVRAVVVQVVATRSARLRAARELEAQPGLLTSGRPGGCTATHRLVGALAAAGSSLVRAPHCTLCRRVTDLPVGLDGGGRACAACHDRLLAQHCPGCGETRSLHWRRVDGAQICLPCHNRQRAIHAKVGCCPACRATRLLSRIRTDGTRICRVCDQRELAVWTRGWVAHFRRDRGSRVPGVAQVNDETRTALILAAVAAADPTLPQETARDVLARVAPTPRARGWLARELTRQPDVLTSGRPDGSGAMQRLIAALIAGGSTGVRAPHCTLCRRIRPLPVSLPSGGRVCGPCRDWLAATLCPGCGQRRRAAMRTTDGTTLCTVCARHDPSRWEPCVQCGRRRPVVRRTADGPYCGPCRPEPTDLPCAECGRDNISRRPYAGTVLCRRCAVAPARVCDVCGMTRLRVDPDPGCPRCTSHQTRRCPACDDTWFAYGGSGCYRCRLQQRLTQLTEGADPGRVAQLQPFLSRLGRVDDPRRGLDWLYRSRTAQHLLADMLHGRQPVQHATLDAVNAGRQKRSSSVEHLRILLVASAVLPERDEPLHRLEQDIGQLLAGCDPADRALLRQWVLWHVLPRARRRVENGQPSDSVLSRARTSIIIMCRFAAWLRQHGSSLAALTQAPLDEWAADNLDDAAELASFLRWAVRRRHVPRGLRPPEHQPRTVRLHSSQDELYAAARRCLTDHTIPAGHRLAAGLVVLYGQPLTRICRLRTSDLHLEPDGTATLRLGRTPVVLLSPLADAARHLIQTPAHGAARTGVGTGFASKPEWLFPGLPLTRHIGTAALAERIHLLLPGNLRGHRNTALLTLARDVPPVVLADLLGLHPGTVERWRALAGGNLVFYTAARLRNRATPRTLGS